MCISFSTIRPFYNLQITFWSLTSSSFIYFPLAPPYAVNSVGWSVSSSLSKNLAYLFDFFVIYLMKLLGLLESKLVFFWEADDESLIWWTISPGASSFFSNFTSSFFWTIFFLDARLVAKDDREIIELNDKFDFIPSPLL